MSRFLAVTLLILGQTLTSGQLAYAQVPGAGGGTSGATQLIKAEVLQIPIGGELTVNMLDGKEYYGHLSSTDADTFAIREVDLKQTLVLRYQDVKQVRKDYGRPGFGGRRVHPHKRLITGLIIVGVLLAVVIAAVASDKS